MPTVREIEQSLFDWAPRELAADWDNVGHLLGSPGDTVSRVLTALDITEEVADEAMALGCQLIVSHHPVMNCKWLPVQTVREDRPQGHLLLKLLRNNISAICMHTNLDRAQGGVNDVLAARLGLEAVEKLPGGDDVLRVGELPEAEALPDFLRRVKVALGPNGIRFADGGKPIRRVAVGGGACGGYLWAAAANGCDAFVTSDLKYNQFLDAGDLGLTVADAGHFPTEDAVCPMLVQYLKEKFPGVPVEKSASHREAVQYYV